MVIVIAGSLVHSFEQMNGQSRLDYSGGDFTHKDQRWNGCRCVYQHMKEKQTFVHMCCKEMPSSIDA